MSKKEMAAWYWAVCEAAQTEKEWAGDGEEALECWEAFFMGWCQTLYIEAGAPKGFPWRVDGA